jgi:hypothetical protein
MSMMMSLNFANREPCRGFVKKSAIMMPVGQCTRYISPLAMRSFIKKYRMLMCQDRCPAEERQFFSIFMVLILCLGRIHCRQSCTLVLLCNFWSIQFVGESCLRRRVQLRWNSWCLSSLLMIFRIVSLLIVELFAFLYDGLDDLVSISFYSSFYAHLIEYLSTCSHYGYGEFCSY